MNRLPLHPGDIATSLAGRDRGRCFVVMTELDDDYVLIADGGLRTVDRPKKKKRKHLKATGARMDEWPEDRPPGNHVLKRTLKQPEKEG